VAEADARAVIRLDETTCARLLPRRDPAGHKGTFGTVLCVAGSLDYLGAALLTAMSAVRAGAGLVALAVPRSLQPLVAGRIPEVVTIGLPVLNDSSDIDAGAAFELLAERAADAYVIGPGLAETEGYRSLLLRLLSGSRPPVVVDGSGLNLLARSGDWWKGIGCNCVLTPHPGEFARLTGSSVGHDEHERIQRSVNATHKFDQVVVLKGAHTVIGEPTGRVAVAPFAIPALATAGSGDVLAGLIGALLAQGLRLFDAACLGVYLHGRAGERLAGRFGEAGLAASDLPQEIALARHELSANSA